MTKKIFYLLTFILALGIFYNVRGQEELKDILKNFKIGGGVDFYYAWDTDKDKALREISAISPHRDEFRLNLANISVEYKSQAARGKFVLHYGDLVKENWQTEHPNIQEANIGIEIYDNLWIDAGYFISPFGEESFPNESSFSTYSLPSYYEPFYQSGIIISYDYKDNIGGSFYIVNGFNTIEDNNKNKSFGLNFYYRPNEYIEFLYNSLLGNEMPSSVPGKMRLMNDFIFSFGPYKNFEATFLFDLTLQENSKLSDSSSSAYVYGALLNLKYHITKKFNAMLRAEYFQDLDGVLSGVVTNNMGMKGNGISLGFEYRPLEKAYFRIESRYLNLDDALKIFYNNRNDRLEIVISSGISF
ncbi:MAG: porin [Ignavibacteria bacterium]|nr:porin [Ignavibacteria bacterium]